MWLFIVLEFYGFFSELLDGLLIQNKFIRSFACLFSSSGPFIFSCWMLSCVSSAGAHPRPEEGASSPQQLICVLSLSPCEMKGNKQHVGGGNLCSKNCFGLYIYRYT